MWVSVDDGGADDCWGCGDARRPPGAGRMTVRSESSGSENGLSLIGTPPSPTLPRSAGEGVQHHYSLSRYAGEGWGGGMGE
jgi:hypothetical protein